MLKMKATCSFPTINPIKGKFQEKEITPSEELQEVTSDENYDGLSKVVVNAIPSEYIIPTGTENITANGTYDITTKASVNVNVPSEEINLQEKSISVATNGSVEVTADSGYTGLSKVNVSNTQELEEVSVTPTTGSQTITPTGNKLINQVNVSAVDSSIDSNIVASNIKNGVQILGVTGTLNEGITPSGNLDITENGTYDVTNYASANVNVEGSGGADLSDYFSDTIYAGSQYDEYGGWAKVIKKFRSPLLVYNSFCDYMFYKYPFDSLPKIDNSNVTTYYMKSMFESCKATDIDLSNINTSNVYDIRRIFYTSSVVNLNLLNFNASKVNKVKDAFQFCNNLKNINGCFQNLGENYSVSYSANYSDYELNLSSANNITEQSIINMLNGLYDIATKGCNVQKITIGSTNLAKLTSEAGQQALTQAQNYGWTVE